MFIEFIVFCACLYYTFKVFGSWYIAINNYWPKRSNLILRVIPLMISIIILYVLLFMASFDVVNDPVYIFFYLVLGYAWVAYGLRLMLRFFNVSWRDDALERNNTAALCTVFGGVIGLTIIYSGANIGDGPGWWCVIYAGGLGLFAWFILGIIIDKFTNAFEQITVDRNKATGIRIGGYLLASGLILGRAVAGDWTSFGATIIEFMDGWPVLFLSLLTLFVEKFYQNSENKGIYTNPSLFGSYLWAFLYILLAILAVYLIPPLRENPAYPVMIGVVF